MLASGPKPLTIRHKHGQPGRKLGGKKQIEKTLVDEADQRQSRSRLDPSITKDVEDRLIAGESVADICDNVDVSAPTVYVIKARLRKEGRL